MEEIENLLLDAEDLFNKGEHERSLAICGRIFELDSHNEMANIYCAINWYALGNLKNALRHFRLCKSKFVHNPIVWERYAFALSLTGNMQEAITEFEGIIKTLPDYTNVFYNFGYCLAGNGYWDRAIEYFNKAEEAGTQTPELYFYRGSCFYNLKRWMRAKIELVKAEELNAENPETAFLLGEICFNYDEYKQAIYYYSKALYFNTDYHKALTQRLICRLNNKNEQGNIYDLEAAQGDANKIIHEKVPFFSAKDAEGNTLRIDRIEIEADGNIKLFTTKET